MTTDARFLACWKGASVEQLPALTPCVEGWPAIRREPRTIAQCFASSFPTERELAAWKRTAVIRGERDRLAKWDAYYESVACACWHEAIEQHEKECRLAGGAS